MDERKLLSKKFREFLDYLKNYELHKNKLIKNLEITQEFKSRVKDFLMQHMFYSVEGFLSF